MLRVSEKCKNDDNSKLTLVSMFHWLERGCSQIRVSEKCKKDDTSKLTVFSMFFNWLVHDIFYILEDGCIWSQNSWLYNAASLCYLVAAFLKVPEIYISYLKKKEKEKRAKKKETKTTVVSLKTHFLNKNQILMCQNYLFVYTNQMFLYKAVHSCLVYSSRYKYVESIRLDVFLLLIS